MAAWSPFKAVISRMLHIWRFHLIFREGSTQEKASLGRFLHISSEMNNRTPHKPIWESGKSEGFCKPSDARGPATPAIELAACIGRGLGKRRMGSGTHLLALRQKDWAAWGPARWVVPSMPPAPYDGPYQQDGISSYTPAERTPTARSTPCSAVCVGLWRVGDSRYVYGPDAGLAQRLCTETGDPAVGLAFEVPRWITLFHIWRKNCQGWRCWRGVTRYNLV